MGITTLDRRGEVGERVQAVRVRMVVENHDDAAPWRVDTRQQIFTIEALAVDRTTFARMHVVPPPPSAYSTLLLGPGGSRPYEF
jgi:hypothetical protein